MSDAASWLVTAAGAVLVLVALRDLFHTVGHPTEQGALSRRVMRAMWRTGRRGRLRNPMAQLRGPLAMVVVVSAWLVLIVVGWAMIYWPHLPGSFVFGVGLDAETRSGLLDAVYLSLVTLGTLGFGDIVPESGWLRVAVPLQALVGFTLITAAVAWVLQVYPALERRRTLAARLSLLGRVGALDVIAEQRSALAPTVLESVALDLARLRVDLVQYRDTYFFRDGDPGVSLPAVLGVALDLAEAAARSRQADLRFAGDLLATAVADYVRAVDEGFLGAGHSVRDLVVAYAEDHDQEPARARSVSS